jgi:branched-chain amino acid transport system ATP-binding protein
MPESNGHTGLLINNIEAVYDRVILVLKGVSLEMPAGGIIALLGANGAGKSTTLKAISGLLHGERGEVTKGTIEFLGQKIEHQDAADIVRLGIVQVMEDRRVFEHLTPEDNLLVGAYARRDGDPLEKDLERVYSYFPTLAERRRVKAGYLSGGEQQMLAIGRALMARPKLMLLDEPSLGLAPLLVEEIFEIVRRINRTPRWPSSWRNTATLWRTDASFWTETPKCLRTTRIFKSFTWASVLWDSARVTGKSSTTGVASDGFLNQPMLGEGIVTGAVRDRS